MKTRVITSILIFRRQTYESAIIVVKLNSGVVGNLAARAEAAAPDLIHVTDLLCIL